MTSFDPSVLSGVAAEVAAFRQPKARQTFERRARRFDELAKGHAAGDWLTALGQLCTAQAQAVSSVEPGLSAASPAPPLRPGGVQRDASWRKGLAVILGELRDSQLPPAGAAAASALAKASAEELERSADAVLGDPTQRVGEAKAIFVAAALQVRWTTWAELLPSAGLEVGGEGCPACGSAPVAGIVGGDDKVRYLCCSLCAVEWHLERVHCATCRATKKLAYFTVEGQPQGLKAETCPSCKTYLKLLYREQLPASEPLADDAASLALDLLMAERGYARGGVNLLVSPLPPLEEP